MTDWINCSLYFFCPLHFDCQYSFFSSSVEAGGSLKLKQYPNVWHRSKPLAAPQISWARNTLLFPQSPPGAVTLCRDILKGGERLRSLGKLAKPLRWFQLKLAVLPVGFINSELTQTLTSMGEHSPPRSHYREPLFVWFPCFFPPLHLTLFCISYRGILIGNLRCTKHRGIPNTLTATKKIKNKWQLCCDSVLRTVFQLFLFTILRCFCGHDLLSSDLCAEEERETLQRITV